MFLKNYTRGVFGVGNKQHTPHSRRTAPEKRAGQTTTRTGALLQQGKKGKKHSEDTEMKTWELNPILHSSGQYRWPPRALYRNVSRKCQNVSRMSLCLNWESGGHSMVAQVGSHGQRQLHSLVKRRILALQVNTRSSSQGFSRHERCKSNPEGARTFIKWPLGGRKSGFLLPTQVKLKVSWSSGKFEASSDYST